MDEMIKKEDFPAYYRDLEICHELPTEMLISMLVDPQGVNGMAILLTLFRRGVKDQILETFPDDRDRILHVYQTYERVQQRIIEQQGKEWAN